LNAAEGYGRQGTRKGLWQDKSNGGRTWFFFNDFNKKCTSIVNIGASTLLVPALCTATHKQHCSELGTGTNVAAKSNTGRA
jgi:hypothetical protein